MKFFQDRAYKNKLKQPDRHFFYLYDEALKSSLDLSKKMLLESDEDRKHTDRIKAVKEQNNLHRSRFS